MLQGAHAISNRAYHENTTRISKSGLDLIARSPAHYYAAYLDPKREPRKETPALVQGRAAHLAILEPHLFKEEFALHPGFNMRTNQGKADYEAWLEKIGPGKTVIDVDVYDISMRMRDAVHKHPAAAELLQTGYPEQTFFWNDQETGVACKCRTDFMTPSRIIVDIKTTENASPDAFGRSAANYRYHVQGAYYADGLTANGYTPEGFVFIAVEKAPPFAVAVYYLDEQGMEAGRLTYSRNLSTYKDCLSNKAWPGYSDEVTPLQLPNYALKL
jgi:exodeoxyribonuclease VIII